MESSDESTVEALFCGDVILNGGVGAFFEGCASSSFEFTQDFTNHAPDSCLIFSGHEYMTMNLRFATYLDDDDDFTRLVLNTIVLDEEQILGHSNQSSMKVERYANPFFPAVENGRTPAPFVVETKIAEKRNAHGGGDTCPRVEIELGITKS